jgi:hypothetical protein
MNIPPIKPVKTVTRIRSKGPTVKDPIRFPRIITPIEKKVTDSYLKMENTMVKMIQVELVKQTKR